MKLSYTAGTTTYEKHAQKKKPSKKQNAKKT